MQNYVKCFFSEDGVYVHEMEQWQNRGTNTIELIRRLFTLARKELVGKRGIAFAGDKEPAVSAPGQFDVAFSSVKTYRKSSFFNPLPDPYSLGWPQVGIPEPEKLMKLFLDNQEKPITSKMFWIGAETHLVRRRLVELSRDNMDILDARMMAWPSSWTGHRHIGPKVPLEHHIEYKYLIDCPGTGYSARLKWLLCTGRPVFVVQRNSVEFWHDFLIEWEHYIPVREDLSDLITNYSKLENDPDLYDHVSKSAKAFARKHLFLAQQLSFCATILAFNSLCTTDIK